MQTKDSIINFLKQNKQIIQEKYDVNKIGLFGSFARDEATKDSDIDILVDMKSSFDNFFELKYFLEDAFQTKVDLGKEKNLRLLVKEQIKKELIYV
jgi:predicted nucleotidyltransferase